MVFSRKRRDILSLICHFPQWSHTDPLLLFRSSAPVLSPLANHSIAPGRSFLNPFWPCSLPWTCLDSRQVFVKMLAVERTQTRSFTVFSVFLPFCFCLCSAYFFPFFLNWRFLTQVYSITVRSCKAGHRTQGLMCDKQALHQPRHTPLPHYIILPKTVHTLPDHKILCIIHCV